jgi:hypothetical protein
MLIAEALAERKDILKRLNEFPSKLADLATWDEDEENRPTPGQVEDLRADCSRDLDRFQELNVAINKANNEMLVKTESGEMTVMEAVALRDRLALAQRVMSKAEDAIDTKMGGDYNRYSRRTKEDIKRNTLVAPREMARAEDALAGQIRRLDLAIQQVNWTQELPE